MNIYPANSYKIVPFVLFRISKNCDKILYFLFPKFFLYQNADIFLCKKRNCSNFFNPVFFFNFSPLTTRLKFLSLLSFPRKYCYNDSSP